MKARSVVAMAALPLLACTTVIQVGATPVEIADAGDGGARPPDASTGCVELAVGPSSRTIQHAGLTRRYEVVRSANTPSCGKLQALFGFHALGSNATTEGQRGEIVLERMAPTEAIGVFINGAENARGQTGWGCAGCDEFEAADDIGLVRAIIAELGIDPSRSVALGADIGGSFVHRLVAELPLAAGAVIGGTLGSAVDNANANTIVRPTAKAPAAMFLQHGADDPVFPFGGGRGERGPFVSSFADATTFWRRANGCFDEEPKVVTTSLSSTQHVECNGFPIWSTRWTGAKHVPPDSDPENPDIGLRAIVDRLLAR